MQEQITKARAKEIVEAVDEMFKAIPKSKQMEYLGHFNDVCLFLEQVSREAKK